MKLLKRFLLFILIVFIAAGAFIIKQGYDKYRTALDELPLDTAISQITSKKHYTVYNDIPQVYFDAVVAVEDRRFYTHHGFDVIGTARALYNDIRARKLIEGGSTITQQLVKNIYFPNDYTLKRKIAEIFMAVRLETEYSKQDILEFYVNGIYYGSGYHCIYDASMGYFEKIPADMTFDECTLLAGIPNAPSIYSLDVSPELARQRQRQVIRSMKECGYIEEDYDEGG